MSLVTRFLFGVRAESGGKVHRRKSMSRRTLVLEGRQKWGEEPVTEK